MTHIKTLTASSSSTISFAHGSSDVVLDSTYPVYLFKFSNVHPATNSVHFQVNFRDGSTAYDATKTTTNFRAEHNEADSETALGYAASRDLAQSTAAQTFAGATLGNGNDESLSGELHLFDPSSTTFVKHFIARASMYHESNAIQDCYVAGYCNVTAAIDGVQFSMSSGNIDAGTFKLYGIKDS
jgi:hypothetical protein